MDIVYANVNVQYGILDLIMYVFYLHFQLTKRFVTSISYHIQTSKQQQQIKQNQMPRNFSIVSQNLSEKKNGEEQRAIDANEQE